jgi:hypothetical protein
VGRLVCTELAGVAEVSEKWRRRPELNRGWRFCSFRLASETFLNLRFS